VTLAPVGGDTSSHARRDAIYLSSGHPERDKGRNVLGLLWRLPDMSVWRGDIGFQA
jgi:hypothetical protein